MPGALMVCTPENGNRAPFALTVYRPCGDELLLPTMTVTGKIQKFRLRDMLRDGTLYRDLGPEYFARRSPAKLAANLANRIRNLGYHVEISAAA